MCHQCPGWGEIVKQWCLSFHKSTVFSLATGLPTGSPQLQEEPTLFLPPCSCFLVPVSCSLAFCSCILVPTSLEYPKKILFSGYSCSLSFWVQTLSFLKCDFKLTRITVGQKDPVSERISSPVSLIVCSASIWDHGSCNYVSSDNCVVHPP